MNIQKSHWKTLKFRQIDTWPLEFVPPCRGSIHDNNDVNSQKESNVKSENCKQCKITEHFHLGSTIGKSSYSFALIKNVCAITLQIRQPFCPYLQDVFKGSLT